MHRAEKSSSRICRNREVERAQELHRKKLDGVKSYLVGVTRPPIAVKPLALFRRKPQPPHPSNPRGDGERNAEEHCTDDENGDDAYEDEEDGGMLMTSTLSRASMNSLVDDHDADDMETQCSGNGTTASSQQPHHSLAKLDDFCSAVPVGLDTSTHHRRLVHLHHQSPGKAPPPPPPRSKKKPLHSAFRLRRLKEIRADNVGLLERIKKSAAHYRNDALQRDWAQNVSYLASICEFPVTLESLVAAPSPRHPPVQPYPFGDVFSRPHGRMDTPESLLPSIHQHQPQQPMVVHPIRAVPTSPRRLQLNLSPAFRSLRKGMPQQPALPLITNAANSSVHGTTACLNALSAHTGAANGVSSMTDFGFHSGDPDDDKHDGASMDSDMLGLPGSPFIGDLGSSACSSSSCLLHMDASASSSALKDATKYRLLKLGRFVGGSYLVLTVFCGDGVTNPYGFDVLAMHQESNREFTLRVTKAMTHELLETVSSSSQAAVTAAAAGTNWSMEDIARSICDHINFTTFEGGMGEMVFLVSNIGGKHDKVLLDSAPAALAFCIHQCVQLTTASSSSSDLAAAIPQNGRSTTRKRRLHVFASTRLAKSYSTTCVTGTAFEETARQRGDDSGLVICFQMHDDTAKKQQFSAPPAAAAAGDLEVEIAIHDLYEIVKKTMSIDGMSLERIVVAAVRHLHIVRAPYCGGSRTTTDDDHIDTFKEVLIVNHHVNTLLAPIASPIASTTKQKKALKPKTSRGKHLLSRGATSSSSVSLFSLRTGGNIPLLESGLIWKHTYLLARTRR
uniref:Uncharacterized protein n=1 Tax=Globisporangium ultimum (strain ATCC 200006 / CBS 805.95 / DAOM BR144) TaxID=431595 RepID=K3WL77_GLOUD